MVQATKSGLLRSAFGGARALTFLISYSSNTTQIELKTGQWVQNLAAVGVGTLITGGLSLVGSGIAAGWTKKIESDLWQFIELKMMSEPEMVIQEKIDGIIDCPFCAEKIKEKATICRYCKSKLTQ